MQAITTKFICPTNHRGPRYKATCDAGHLTLEADHRLGSEENHLRVARALILRLGWTPANGSYGQWYHAADRHGNYTLVCDVEYNRVTLTAGQDDERNQT